MISITLNTGEQQAARLLAKLRHENNRSSNVKNKKIGPQSNDETDLDGIGAEIAVARILNLYPDLSISPRSGGCDLVDHSGKKLDVKQTKYENGHLLATLNKKGEDTDVYILW